MADEETIRARCASLPLEQLLAEVFLHADDFEPEALALYRAGIEARAGDLRELVKREAERTGEIVERVGVKNFVQKGDKLDPTNGELVLTTRGLGYIALGRDSQGVMGGGLLVGAISDWIKSHLETKLPGAIQRDLPLSLLAAIEPTAQFYATEEVERILIRDAVLTIVQTETMDAWCVCEPSVAPKISVWGADHGIRVEIERSRGLVESIRGWWSKK